MSRMNSPSAESYPKVGDLVAVEWHGGRNVLADGPAPVSPTWTATGYVTETPDKSFGSNYLSMTPTGSGFPVAHGRAGVRALNGAVGILDNEDFSLTRENLTVRRSPLDIYFTWRLITPAPVAEKVKIKVYEENGRVEFFRAEESTTGLEAEVDRSTFDEWTRNEQAYLADDLARQTLLTAAMRKGGK